MTAIYSDEEEGQEAEMKVMRKMRRDEKLPVMRKV